LKEHDHESNYRHHHCCQRQLGLSLEDIGAALEMSPVWTTSACLGMNSMPAEKAQRLNFVA
jgi:cyanate lyase